MIIKINYKIIRNLWKIAEDKKTNDWVKKRNAWIALQTIQALAGKESNAEIKRMLTV